MRLLRRIQVSAVTCPGLQHILRDACADVLVLHAGDDGEGGEIPLRSTAEKHAAPPSGPSSGVPLSAVGDAELRSQLASMDVDLLQEWLCGEQEARSVYQR